MRRAGTRRAARGVACLVAVALGGLAPPAAQAGDADARASRPAQPLPQVIIRTGPGPASNTPPFATPRGLPQGMRPADGMDLVRAERALQSNDPETARTLFQRLWDRGVRLPRVAVGYGESLIELSKAGAVDSLAASLPSSDPARPYLEVMGGEALARADKRGEAAARWREAVRRAPDEERLELLEAVGRFEASHAMWDDAVKTWIEARKASGKDDAYARELGDARFAAGRKSDAAADYVDLIVAASPDRPYADSQLNTIYGEMPSLRKSGLERLRQALRQHPERNDLSDTVLRWSIADGDCDGAVAEAVRREKFAPAGGAAFLALAEAAPGSRCPDLASRAWRELNAMEASRNPSPAVKLALARLLEESGKSVDAADAYRQLAHESPKGGQGAEALARSADLLLAIPGRAADALEMLENLRTQYPNRPEGRRATIGIAQALLALGRLPEAESRLGELLADTTQAGRSRTLAPEEEEQARYLRARLLYFKGDFDGAHAELDRVVNAFPRGETVNDCLDLLFFLDAAGDATDDFRRVANADYLVFRGDLAGAAGILDPLVARDGALGAEAGWRRAAIARKGGKPADAIALLDRVAAGADEPLRSRALEEAAAIERDDLHDHARARHYLEAILTGDPEGPFADRARRALDALPRDLP